MALTSKDSLLKALYGAGIQPAAMNTATGAAALTGADTSANTTPAPKVVSTPYTSPTYASRTGTSSFGTQLAAKSTTPPPVSPVTVVNNPAPTPPLAPQSKQWQYYQADMTPQQNQYMQTLMEGHGELGSINPNMNYYRGFVEPGTGQTPSKFSWGTPVEKAYGGNADWNQEVAETDAYNQKAVDKMQNDYGLPYPGTAEWFKYLGTTPNGNPYASYAGGYSPYTSVSNKVATPPGGNNIQNPPAGNPPAGGYTGPKQSSEGYQYLGPAGQPYKGEGTAYWYNTAEKKWYSGDKATNKITPGGAIAPWNTPPGGGQNQQDVPPGGGTPQGATYYGPGGGIYDPATDKTSYWYNAAEGVWYQGDTATGKVSAAAGGPPWMDTTSDPRFSSLVDKMSSMPYDKEYVDLMGGKLREQLQAGAGTTREELANRLGGAGVFGGAAQSQLRGVDAATALGTSQGMGDIYKTAMGNAYNDRRAALGALQGKEWQNVQKMLGGTNAELAMEQMNQSGMFRSQENQVNLAVQLLQMAQNASGEDQQMLYLLATQLLSGSGSSILQGGV